MRSFTIRVENLLRQYLTLSENSDSPVISDFAVMFVFCDNAHPTPPAAPTMS